jgi:hypothetical protein
MWRNDVCGGMTYPDQRHVEEYFISSTSIWSGYVIPPHISVPDMSFLHIHISGPDMSFLHIHLVRICDSSTFIRPDMSFLHIHLVRICYSSTYIWSGYVMNVEE